MNQRFLGQVTEWTVWPWVKSTGGRDDWLPGKIGYHCGEGLPSFKWAAHISSLPRRFSVQPAWRIDGGASPLRAKTSLGEGSDCHPYACGRKTHLQQTGMIRIQDRRHDTRGRECATAILAVSGGTPVHFTNNAYDAPVPRTGGIRPLKRMCGQWSALLRVPLAFHALRRSGVRLSLYRKYLEECEKNNLR